MELRKKVLSSLATLLVFDAGEKQRMVREAAAKAYGLNGDDYAKPYTNHQSYVSHGNGFVKGAVIGAALIACGWLLSRLVPDGKVPPVPIEKIIDKTKDVDLGIDVDYVPPARTQ